MNTTRVATPNDPKLSDGGGLAHGLRGGSAGSSPCDSPEPFVCSAWLGVSRLTFIASVFRVVLALLLPLPGRWLSTVAMGQESSGPESPNRAELPDQSRSENEAESSGVAARDRLMAACSLVSATAWKSGPKTMEAHTWIQTFRHQVPRGTSARLAGEPQKCPAEIPAQQSKGDS